MGFAVRSEGWYLDKNFEIERALEKINSLNNQIQSKTTTVLELIRPPLPPFP